MDARKDAPSRSCSAKRLKKAFACMTRLVLACGAYASLALGAAALADGPNPRGFVQGVFSPSETIYDIRFDASGERILTFGSRGRWFRGKPPYDGMGESAIDVGPRRFSADGELLYLFSKAHKGFEVRKASDQTMVRSFGFDPAPNFVSRFTVSRDSTFLVAGGGRHFDVIDGTSGMRVLGYDYPEYVNSLELLELIDDDRKALALWTRHSDRHLVALEAVDVATSQATSLSYRVSVGYHMAPPSLAVAPDGLAFVAFEEDNASGNRLVLVDARTLRPRWRVPLSLPAYRLTFAPSGRYILADGTPASENSAASSFRVFDAATGTLILTMPSGGVDPRLPSAKIFAFSPDGRTLATCSRDPEEPQATIVLWDWAKIEAELLNVKKP